MGGISSHNESIVTVVVTDAGELIWGGDDNAGFELINAEILMSYPGGKIS